MVFTEIFDSEPLKTLAEAVDSGDLLQIEEQTRNGIDINKKANCGMTVLFWATITENKKSFKKLLELGADPNIILRNDNSVIFCCAGLNDPYYLIESLKHGADPNLVEPRQKETPLFRAATPNGIKNIQILIKAGVDLNKQNKFGNTALLEAASLNQYDVVYELIVSGADYSVVNRWNNGLDYFLKESRNINKSSELYKWRQKVFDLINIK